MATNLATYYWAMAYHKRRRRRRRRRRRKKSLLSNLQRKVTSAYNRDDVRTYLEKGGKDEVGTKMEMELYPTGTGSSLPDCSHACGPCFPCKRVMVSFSKCSSTSESCPIVYREEAIQADRIVARDGLGMLKRIGRLGGFHHLFVVGEDDGVVVLIPELHLTESLLSDGDDGGEEMKAGRVSLKAYLGVGLEWAWAGSARASSDWALTDEFGLEPLM
ncbi:hypothetical protein ACLB2K_013275 [Fragaria x ananassa]